MRGGFLCAFRGLARHVTTLAIPGEAASLGAGALYDAAREAGLEASPADDLDDAMMQVSGWAQAREEEGPAAHSHLRLALSGGQGAGAKTVRRKRQATGIEASIHSLILVLGSAPTLVAATWPSRKIISVGMPRTPYLVGVCGFSSILILATVSLPLNSLASSSSDGRDHAAWAAPFRPEIHHDRRFGIEHFGLEIAIGDFDRMPCIPREILSI